MNTTSQALLIGNALKQSPQLFTLLIGECCAKRFVMLVRNPADITQDGLPLVCEVNGVDPAVVRTILSLHQPPFLQLVDDRYETARVHPQNDRQILLA
jgi:hypothetical protein